MDIITIIQTQQNLIVGKPGDVAEIANAEKTLNVAFSKDYKEYLLTFGFAMFEGHELTGLCDGKRLDVIKITNFEKNFAKNISQDWYVVEQTNIDGIVIWQDKDGIVYQVNANGSIDNTYPSLTEYIEKTKV